LHEAEQVQCKKVVVVGGGYIGLEMAEAFTRWGASAVVLDGGDQVMRTLDADMAKLVAYAMERLGLPVHLGVRATGFDERQVITDHGEFEADIVVLGLGVQPNSEVAGEAGIERGGARRHRGRRSSAHERGWCVGRGRLL
jgi:NADPH-dependent 2,4-dienoyl-CoA reductase/sulfur reductase-like enzyme